MSLTKDQIKQANDIVLSEYDVPEWGGSIFIRSLSGAQMADAQKAFKKASDQEKLTLMIIYCACDEQGNQLFSFTDTPWLNAKNMNVLLRVVNECNRVNGFADEELEKNSETIQTKDTGSK